MVKPKAAVERKPVLKPVDTVVQKPVETPAVKPVMAGCKCTGATKGEMQETLTKGIREANKEVCGQVAAAVVKTSLELDGARHKKFVAEVGSTVGPLLDAKLAELSKRLLRKCTACDARQGQVDLLHEQLNKLKTESEEKQSKWASEREVLERTVSEMRAEIELSRCVVEDVPEPVRSSGSSEQRRERSDRDRERYESDRRRKARHEERRREREREERHRSGTGKAEGFLRYVAAHSGGGR